MTHKPLFTTEAGVKYTWEDDGEGGGLIHGQADVAPLIDANKAMATHNDGYTPSREMRRVASIPTALINKWLVEEGVDIFKPENAAWLARRLNDPDYAFLRTDSRQQLGVVDGGSAFR